jgi:hypothetical protein
MTPWPDHDLPDRQVGIRDYLLRHEEDIALGVNGFNDLKEAFFREFGRKPEKAQEDKCAGNAGKENLPVRRLQAQKPICNLLKNEDK